MLFFAAAIASWNEQYLNTISAMMPKVKDQSRSEIQTCQSCEPPKGARSTSKIAVLIALNVAMCVVVRSGAPRDIPACANRDP